MGNETTVGIVGEGRYVDVSDLRLDACNPRFPINAKSGRQEDIAVQMASVHDAYEIAKKIAIEGYHAAEPPAVIEDKDGTYIVVEGNRRLTALLGLSNKSLREKFPDSKKWQEAAERGAVNNKIPEVIPVVIYPSREAAAPLLGSRHIQGPKKWEPKEQDRYIVDLVSSGKNFEEAAEICGITINATKKAYRNYLIISEVATRLGIDVTRVPTKYSVLGLAWDNNVLRQHANVISVADVQVGVSPIRVGLSDTKAKTDLSEILVWVLGTNKKDPVLKESRQIHKLGQAASNSTGLLALRNGDSLELALQKVSDEGAAPFDSATRMLTTATNALTRASAQIDLLETAEKTSMLPKLLEIKNVLVGITESINTPNEET